MFKKDKTINKTFWK